ncbi:MAG: YbhB/YbcL family Raf kinase inhibitor-like protein [Sphingomicrobium sp.]
MTWTMVKFPLALALIALASCGASDGVNNQSSNGGATVEKATLTKLRVTSDAFHDGQPVPMQYTCDGADQAPALHWSEPPPGTKSFALVIDDPDAPGGTFHHWGVFDIPAAARSIGGGERIGTEVTNDFGKRGYGGPCPPKGLGPHHYHFKLFALNVEKLGLAANAKVADVDNAARHHTLAQGELVGTYERR